MTGSPTFSGVLFGAAYYAEYQPEGTLERDLDLMKNAGFTVIRVGESVWSTWEPREGEFDLDWMQPVLDGAHARGIGVILGTPTYAVPPWLQKLHPEIAAETSTGHRMGWGARQEMDQAQPAYRFYAERVSRRILERYASHPAIIGFQVDNEPGNVLPHNDSTFHAFIAWLRRKYGTVERLNDEWGLVYWSHRIQEWAELWRPDGNLMPQYQLEWRRFQSTQATDLIAWQAEMVREYAGPEQFVTTCISYTRDQVADDELAASLDVVAGNPYYKMQDGLDARREVPREDRWWHTGVWALFQWGDRAYSTAGAQYLVTETNAQSIGGSWQNHPPYPGQIKQAAFALLARGGRMIEYWHWHTLHFGVETYWGGVLPHSQEPGRIYREVAALGSSLKALGSALDDYVPDADALILWSTDTKWSWNFYPPLSQPDGSPDPDSYTRIFDAFYRGAFEAGLQLRVQHVADFLKQDAADLARRYPVLFAPALYVVETAVLDHLVAYAEAGGHLVAGVRTGYGDELARARRAVAPDRIGEPGGIRYDEYSNISSMPVVSGDIELDEGSAATEWLDVLEVDGADVVVSFGENELGARAALTTRAHGRGRISYLATVPNAPLARSIASWLDVRTAASEWKVSRTVTVQTGRAGTRRLAFVANWTGEPAVVVPPVVIRDLETGEAFPAGSPLLLDPRAARVFEVSTDPVGSVFPSTERI